MSDEMHIYPRISPYSELGEVMVQYARFGKWFIGFVIFCLIVCPWVVFPFDWVEQRETLTIILVILSLIGGLALLTLGIIVLVLFILFFIKLNDTSLATRNIYLRRSFTMELISVAVFAGINIAGNIIVPIMSDRLDSFELLAPYIKMPGLTFYMLVLLIESIIPRIFKVLSVVNLQNWAENLGVLIYDDHWSDFKHQIIIKFRRMKWGQILSLIPILSFIMPIMYYNALHRAGRLLNQLAPHLNEVESLKIKQKRTQMQ